MYREAVEAPVSARVPGNPTRFGSTEPRICTPPLRPLTPDTSLGFEVVEFADEVLGVELLPWQKAALIRALELLPDGSLRFRTVVILVARQNGKSTISRVLILWWLYVVGCRTILGTAQDLDTAEDVWEAVLDTIEANPELDALADRPVKVNGKKTIRLKTGERYKVKSANRRAARGLTGNRIVLDELREHQTWDAWGAVTKTLRTIADGQIWCFSNAGDVTSVVLQALRVAAHRALGDPDRVAGQADADAAELAVGPDEFELDLVNELRAAVAATGADSLDPEVDLGELVAADFDIDTDDLFLGEWSTDPDRAITDRDGWAQSNPSLGYLVSERTMASEAATDAEHVFRTEALCQWPPGAIRSPFPAGTWEATTNVPDESGAILEQDLLVPGQQLVAAVAVSYNRERTYIAWAGRRADGVAQAEVVAARPGTDWVAGWLKDRAGLIRSVTGQSNGEPTGSLIAELKADRGLGVPVVDLAGQELTAAFSRAHDAVRDGKVRHNRQRPLDRAASVAVLKPLGSGDVLDDRRSPLDVAPLAAWVYAVNGLLKPGKFAKPPPPPPRPVPTEWRGATGARPPRHGKMSVDVTTAGF